MVNPTPSRVGTGYEQEDPGVYIAGADGLIVYSSDTPVSRENAEHIVSSVNVFDFSEGVKRIARERRRQYEEENWTVAHDDEHWRGELSAAGACYALATTFARPNDPWPWGRKRDKRQSRGAPLVARIRALEKA